MSRKTSTRNWPGTVAGTHHSTSFRGRNAGYASTLDGVKPCRTRRKGTPTRCGFSTARHDSALWRVREPLGLPPVARGELP
jgi:hypothetical protein